MKRINRNRVFLHNESLLVRSYLKPTKQYVVLHQYQTVSFLGTNQYRNFSCNLIHRKCYSKISSSPPVEKCDLTKTTPATTLDSYDSSKESSTDLLQPPEQRSLSTFSSYYTNTASFLQKIYLGLKEFAIDFRECTSQFYNDGKRSYYIYKDHRRSGLPLSRAEYRHISQFKSNLLTAVPFLAMISVTPVVLVPVVLYLIPGILPKVYSPIFAKVGWMKRWKEKNLQQTKEGLKMLRNNISDLPEGLSLENLKDSVPSMYWNKKFNQDALWKNQEMIHVYCKILDLGGAAWKPKFWLLKTIESRLESIRKDDELIWKEGSFGDFDQVSMGSDIAEAMKDRRLDDVAQLKCWLELSQSDFAQDVPTAGLFVIPALFSTLTPTPTQL